MAAKIPVGSVVAIAGDLADPELQSAGWLVCKGQSLPIQTHEALFQVIGFAHGNAGPGSFNLPDYRGRWLRGVDGGTGRDPDAATRLAMAPGGATGNAVGTIQGFATALPKKPLMAGVPNLPGDYHYAYGGPGAKKLWWWDGTVDVETKTGGDAETRPDNASVRFVIASREDTQLPTGAVLPFAGANRAGLGTAWLFCDGTEYPKAQYPDLVAAIGTHHGGTAEAFHIPDYRGFFMRGQDEGAGRDPDRAARYPAFPGGTGGDATGSVQGWTTALPAKPFVVKLANLGGNPIACGRYPGHDNSVWNPGSVEIDLTYSGGDLETRPVNANVDFFIRTEPDAKAGDPFPIGGIIAYPGGKPPAPAQWMLCDGAVLPIASHQALWDVIGAAHGGDGKTTFRVPDYRGRFLRGVCHGYRRDPAPWERDAPVPGVNGGPAEGNAGDLIGSVQGWATARSDNRFKGSVPHLPVGHDIDPAALSTAHNVCEWREGMAQVPVTDGGDAETRPINAYTFWYIRYAE